VMPLQSVSFIAKFEDFADNAVPYMYHCHLLHHEDEGMMGSFLVMDPNGIEESILFANYPLYPNPANSSVSLQLAGRSHVFPNVQIIDALGKVTEVEFEMMDNKIVLQTNLLPAGFYTVLVNGANRGHFLKE
jgi:hypothetical protein